MGIVGLFWKDKIVINTESHYGKYNVNSEIRIAYFKSNIKKKEKSW